MNVINRLTLRHLKLNKKRTLVTIIGVILSVSMITAVTTFVASAQDMMLRVLADEQGDWHAVFPDIDPAKADLFLSADSVKEAMFVRNLGYSVLPGSGNTQKPYLFVHEFAPESLTNLAVNLVRGRLPERADELVISEHILTNAGVSINIGDKLQLPIGQRYAVDTSRRLTQENAYRRDSERLEPQFTREYTVVGTISRPNFENRSAPGYTVISYLDTSTIAATDWLDAWVQYERVNKSIYSQGQELADLAGVKQYVEEPDGQRQYLVRYNTQLLALHGVTDRPQVNIVFYVFATVAILAIMIGSISLIYNAFAISTAERAQELGMLASVGATRRQKRNAVLFEGLVIGLIGIPLGIIAGMVGMGVTFYFVAPILADVIETGVRLRLVASLPSIVAAVIIAALTIFISVWLPARTASRVSPIEAIRKTRDVKLTRKAVRTSKLTRILSGFEAELALKNLKRHRRRFRAAVFSLTVSIVLFLTVSAYANFATIGASMYADDNNYDLRIMATQGSIAEREAFYAQVAALDGVEEHVYRRSLYGRAYVNEAQASDFVRASFDPENGVYVYHNLYIHSLDEAAFQRYVEAIGLRENASSGAIAISLNQYGVGQDGPLVERDVLRARTGDTLAIDLTQARGRYREEITLIGVTDQVPMGVSIWNPPLTLQLIVSESVFYDLLNRLEIEDRVYGATLFANSDDPDALEQSISAISYTSRPHVTNRAREARQQRQFILIMMIFVTGFIVLITSICVANIFNTMSTSIGLRRREFAMLKSVGMTPAGFNRMIRYESMFYGIRALAFGLPISLGINYLLYRVMQNVFAFRFTLPWFSYGITIAGVFLVVFITMRYSSACIKRENIIDALKAEVM